jgi:hypothetical protein
LALSQAASSSVSASSMPASISNPAVQVPITFLSTDTLAEENPLDDDSHENKDKLFVAFSFKNT